MKLLTLITALFLAWGNVFAADEMDKGKAEKEEKAPNLVIVQVDKDGNKISYAAKVDASQEDLKDNPAQMQKVIAEVVVAKNLIKPKEVKSLDEMDQTTSTPAWYYYGYRGYNWYNCNYYYGYRPYYYGYNYYWNSCYYPTYYYNTCYTPYYNYNYYFYWY